MSDANASILVAALLASFLAGLFVNGFLPSYMRRKGENLATKEDVEEITARVESVKTEILFSQERYDRHFQATTDCLLRFHDELVDLFFERLAVNFGDFPNDGGQSIFDHRLAFRANIAEILKSYRRLHIFLPTGSALLPIATAIVSLVIEIRRVDTQHFYAVKTTLGREYEAHKSGDRDAYEAAYAASNDANSRYWREMKPHTIKLRDELNRFGDAMNSFVSSERAAAGSD